MEDREAGREDEISEKIKGTCMGERENIEE